METISTAPVSANETPQGHSHSSGTVAASGLRPASFWKRAAASGTGLAIAIDGDNLDILIVRVRPGSVTIRGYQRFANIKERPAAELGAEYDRFLKANGAPQLPAWVLLPREDLIVRTLSLPGVPAKDLASALDLQLDSLHPYVDQAVQFGYVRIGNTSQVLVGIAREELVDRWIAFFEEAGIKLGGFTFSADALYRAIRCLRVPEPGFATAIECGDAVEIYGESPSRPVYDALLYAGAAPALAHATAELRLDDNDAVRELAELLPAPATVEQAEFAHQHPLLYSTALGAAATFPVPAANLLPMELRRGGNWTAFLPTLILLALLSLLVAGMYGHKAWQERQYAARLMAEVRLLERQVALGQRMDNEGERFLTRLDQLKEHRLRTSADLEALLALTRLLPDDAWITQFDLSRDEISLTGEAARAGDLIGLIDASPLFEKTEFAMPLQRLENREIFRLRVKREAAQ
ncbi:MAG: PilN domain-containing protein [Bryobacterales bacterium]|nr:PilN domain-containing protein [Bryobacterales bacterium]